MSPFALSLVLIAALLHAAWNLVAKKAGGDSRFALLSSLMILVLWGPVGIWAAWGTVPLWGAKEWALIFASGITHLVYFNVLLRGYAVSDLTVVYPVARGTGPLISSFGALLLLDEHMSLGGVLGVFAVTGGVFLIAGGPSLWARAHDPVQRQRVMAGLGYGAATGCMIALYTLIDGYSVKVMLISPILIDYFGNLARLPFMLPSALRKPAAFMESARALWKHALVLAVISPSPAPPRPPRCTPPPRCACRARPRPAAARRAARRTASTPRAPAPRATAVRAGPHTARGCSRAG